LSFWLYFPLTPPSPSWGRGDNNKKALRRLVSIFGELTYPGLLYKIKPIQLGREPILLKPGGAREIPSLKFYLLAISGVKAAVKIPEEGNNGHSGPQ
jgi:hypothetical protein